MNYKKQFISLIGVLVCIFSCQAQTNLANTNLSQVNCTDCNLKDNQGRKYGLWIERKGSVEVYYKNNLRDGVYKSYSRGKLHALGEYSKGMPCGKWYYFNEAGHLLFTEENIKENVEYTSVRDDGVKIKPKFTSYVKDYYPNGVIKEEGQVLYEDDIEVDYYKTGTWKYYDKEGKLTETKEEH